MARGLDRPNLDRLRLGDEGQNNRIGGSPSVVAQLEGASTKYYEINIDVERRDSERYIKGSYTWSHYYGNFDQINGAGNNANLFPNNSHTADSIGHQPWHGDLKGDRRHIFKVYGNWEFAYSDGHFGWLLTYQSGEPLEGVRVTNHGSLTKRANTTDPWLESTANRRTDDYYQLDLSYSQTWTPVHDEYRAKFTVFNVFNKQNGFHNNDVNHADFHMVRGLYPPRRVRLEVQIMF